MVIRPFVGLAWAKKFVFAVIMIFIWAVSQRRLYDSHREVQPSRQEDNAISASKASGFMEGFDRPSDGRLVRYIRETWLVPPSTRQAVKKSSWGKKERHFSQVGQSKFVDKALRKRTGK